MATQDPHKTPSSTSKELMSPLRSTLWIILLYIVMGLLWITLSDTILNIFIPDSEMTEWIQTVKGIAYVVVTGGVFYLIIRRRMDRYQEAIDQQRLITKELVASNERLSELEKKLYKVAYYDPLTGLSSRAHMQELVSNHIRQHPNSVFGLLYIDIDNFRHVNELKGHIVGDELIRLIAKEIQEIAPSPHIIGRLGGDEFIVFLKDVHHKDAVVQIIRDHAHLINHSFRLSGDDFYVSVSIGAVIYPDDGENFELLLRHADIALHVAKSTGRNRIVMYEEIYKSHFKAQVDLSNSLYQAISNNELFVYYQPIMHVETNRINSAEALLRWRHPVLGFVSPAQFIPVAEMSGQIKDITLFVMSTCFKQHAEWKKRGIHLSISINISSKLFNDVNIFTDIEDLVIQYQVNPNDFILEITESVLMENLAESLKIIRKLQSFGFRIAMDDFGTGYSSLTYLQQLPLNILKVDQSFIRQFHSSEQDFPLMKFMVDLAHYIGIQVVVEGVEQAFQVERLKDYHADMIQGYYYAKPMPANEVAHFVEKKH